MVPLSQVRYLSICRKASFYEYLQFMLYFHNLQNKYWYTCNFQAVLFPIMFDAMHIEMSFEDGSVSGWCNSCKIKLYNLSLVTNEGVTGPLSLSLVDSVSCVYSIQKRRRLILPDYLWFVSWRNIICLCILACISFFSATNSAKSKVNSLVSHQLNAWIVIYGMHRVFITLGCW